MTKAEEPSITLLLVCQAWLQACSSQATLWLREVRLSQLQARARQESGANQNYGPSLQLATNFLCKSGKAAELLGVS